MSTNAPVEHDPEDMFSDTRMSIGDHIEDLRTHLLRALKGFAIGMVLGFWPLGPWVLDVINAPIEKELTKFEQRKFKRDRIKNQERLAREGILPQPRAYEYNFDRKELAKYFVLKDLPEVEQKKPNELEPMNAWFMDRLKDLDAAHLLEPDLREHGGIITLRLTAPDPGKMAEDAQEDMLKTRIARVKTLGITEMFFVYMKISFFTGFVISSPWVFYHIWMFIAAGLYPNEKKLVNYYLPASLVLFIGGVLLCEFFAMAQAVRAMLAFNEWLDTDADIRLNEWLGFAIMMPVVFGLAFQTPLVMMFLHKVGIVTVQMLRTYRRIAWFALVIIAALFGAVAGPGESLLLLWVPMVGLYELGILLCVWQGDQQVLFGLGADEEEKRDELVEV